jgi:uncharacterized protein
MKALIILLVAGISVITASGQGKNFIDQHYIEVNGSFDTLVVPDEIYIGISISEKDSRDHQSVEEQEARMITELRSLGIDVEKNLKSKDMTSNFRTYFLKGKEVIKSRHYILKVNDAFTAGKVFKLLEDLDIFNSQLFRIDLSNIKNIRNDARTMAVANATERALALLKPLHQELGKAIYISDNETYGSSANLYGSTASQMDEIVVSGYKKDEPAKIDFQPVKITANVMVRFELK